VCGLSSAFSDERFKVQNSNSDVAVTLVQPDAHLHTLHIITTLNLIFTDNKGGCGVADGKIAASTESLMHAKRIFSFMRLYTHHTPYTLDTGALYNALSLDVFQ
jgi:hypothetical protein